MLDQRDQEQSKPIPTPCEDSTLERSGEQEPLPPRAPRNCRSKVKKSWPTDRKLNQKKISDYWSKPELKCSVSAGRGVLGGSQGDSNVSEGERGVLEYARVPESARESESEARVTTTTAAVVGGVNGSDVNEPDPVISEGGRVCCLCDHYCSGGWNECWGCLCTREYW